MPLSYKRSKDILGPFMRLIYSLRMKSPPARMIRQLRYGILHQASVLEQSMEMPQEFSHLLSSTRKCC